MAAEEDGSTAEATSVSIGSKVGIGDGFAVTRSFVWSDAVGTLETLVEGCASKREPRITNALVDKKGCYRDMDVCRPLTWLEGDGDDTRVG